MTTKSSEGTTTDDINKPYWEQQNPNNTGDETQSLQDLINSPGVAKRKQKDKSKVTAYMLVKSMWKDQRKRESLYVLFVCTIVYMFNQVDRYLQTIEAKDMQIDQGWGPGDGTGIEEDLLVGLVFTAIYLPSGIPIGFVADRLKPNNKKYLFAFFLGLWSLSVFITGFTQKYWQVLVLRFVLGFAESGCTPLAGSIIADSFGPKTRGTAYGIYNWGIYTGFSLAQGAANAMTQNTSWRTVYYTFGAAGLVWIIFVLSIPKQQKPIDKVTSLLKDNENNNNNNNDEHTKPRVSDVLCFFISTPSIIILIFASLIRNAGGYVWGANTKNFFENIRGQTNDQQAAYMSWIPLVAGSLGSLFGGWASDRYVKNSASWKRLVILVVSNLCAAPFALAALLLPAPWCYLSLIGSNVIGEMWVGICLALIVDLVPKNMKTTALSVYFLIIGCGGFFPSFVTLVEGIFGDSDNSLQYALIILFPGLYIVSSLIFLLALTCLKRDERKKKELEEQQPMMGKNWVQK